MIIKYVTSNKIKTLVAKETLEEYQRKGLLEHVCLQTEDLDLDEIQSTNVAEVAQNSARFVFSILREPIAVSDAGLYIEGLNGFPGALLKQMNAWFEPEDILCLLKTRKTRTAEVRECLAVVDEEGHVGTWTVSFKGKIATKPSDSPGTTMERIFIPEGYECPLAEFDGKKQIEYWKTNCTWAAYLSYLNSSQQCSDKKRVE